MSDSAIATLVSGAITITTMVVGFLTLWVKLRYGESKSDKAATKAEEAVAKADVLAGKIDENTNLTKQGTKAATDNARAAAVTAKEAKEATTAMAANINRKLNGGLDMAVEQAIKPLRDTIQDHVLSFQEHVENDARNMKEIRASLAELHNKIK